MEHLQKELEQQISQKNFYQQDKATISDIMARMKQLQIDLHKAYERWEYLAEFGA